MDNIESIKILKENIQNEIIIELNRQVCKFKDYVIVEHDDNQKFTLVGGICTRINYGCKDNKYFWCFLPDDIKFIHNNKKWISNMIFYNDELKWWYVYNRDNKQYVEFDSLDTDSQIAMLEMLENILNQ